MNRILTADAVLFDNDGVLVDSEGVSLTAWATWAQLHGLDPRAVIDGSVGRRSGETVARHLPADRVDAGVELIERLETEVANETRAMPGAVALVGSLPETARAVVTSGTRALATARLRAAGVPVPVVLVTADEVTRGKPHPEPYLRAAQRLGLLPSRCIVLEDSTNGIRAALAAGVGAVVGVGPGAVGQGCDAVIADLSFARWTGVGLELLGVLEDRSTGRRDSGDLGQTSDDR